MIATLAALSLATVLVVSGAAKLLDRRGSAATLSGFGVPERLVPAAGLGLPFAELGIAAALLVPATARAGAAAALVLFAAMTVAVGWTLARGRRPDCGCFGKLHSSPIGRTTIARTLALSSLAAILAATDPDSPAALAHEPVAWLVALASAEGLLLLLLLRRHAQVLRAVS